jgi:hypothetical protein
MLLDERYIARGGYLLEDRQLVRRPHNVEALVRNDFMPEQSFDTVTGLQISRNELQSATLYKSGCSLRLCRIDSESSGNVLPFIISSDISTKNAGLIVAATTWRSLDLPYQYQAP